MSFKSFSRRHLLAFLAASPLGVGTVLTGLPAWAAPQPVRKPGSTAKSGAPLPLPVLVLDAGHGGRDPGAIGRDGTLEKNVTLDLARTIADTLRGQARIVLTREDDRFLPLPERVQIARSHGANLFVSLHADSAPDNKMARGLSAYTLSQEASDSFTARLAETENVVDQRYGAQINGDEILSDILHDLAAEQTIRASRFAKESLIAGVKDDLHLLDNPKRSANFAVLRAPDMPSLLIESGFLSNPQDEQILSSRSSRANIARVIARELGTLIHHPMLT